MIKAFIKIISFNLTRIIGFFTIKNDSIWVFGERAGHLYMDNSKYLFEYISEHKKEIRAIWFTANKHIYEEIKSKGYEVYYFNSFNAYLIAFRAKAYIITHNLEDICNYSLSRAKVFFLFHAMPLKITGDSKTTDVINDAQKVSKFTLLKRKVIQSLTTVDCIKLSPFFIATSEITKETIEKTFKQNNVIITGQPDDAIFYSNISKDIILKKYGLEKLIDHKIILYLPTFRDNKTKFDHSIVDISDESLHNLLNDNNAVILEKCHSNEINSVNDNNNNSVIMNISKINLDIQELLSITDILITDYSSCYFDFLFTERPVIFYNYDYEEYMQYRGLFYDYNEIAAGDKVRTIQSLTQSIKKYLEDATQDLDKRKRIKNKIHHYQDGKSSERVFKEILNHLT